MSQLVPAGIRSLTIAVPEDMAEITLPSGPSAYRPKLTEGQDGLDLEKQAASEAVEIAGLQPEDIDLVISASFPALPEPCIGNATPVAWDLGMKTAAAYNVETACAGGLLALRSACQEVSLGNYKNVLVSVVCPYSPTVEPNHPALTVIADAAYAMVVGPTAEGQEFLGASIRNSGPTCDLVSWAVSDETPSGIRLAVTGKTAGQLEDWAQDELPALSADLFERVGLSPSDVDHWALNAPTPSFVDRTLVSLGVKPSDGTNTNRLLGNVGPALIGGSLYYGARLRNYQPGQLIACCSVGSEASLVFSLMRWPEDVRLGAEPPHATVEMLKAFEDERLGNAAAA